MPVAYDGHEVKGISRNAIFEKGPFCQVIRFKYVSFSKGHFEAARLPAARPLKWERAENEDY